MESIKDSELGPYSGGNYTSPHGKTISLQHVPFDQLQLEVNPEKVVVGKVVCSINHDDPVPL